jgi:hypothetical protein
VQAKSSDFLETVFTQSVLTALLLNQAAAMLLTW